MFVNIGYGNMVSVEKIVCMITSDSAPAKRYVQEARGSGVLVDATAGRKTKGVIFTDDGRVILTALLPETIVGRLKGVDTDEA